MAEFSEVIKQFKRLCMSISPIKCTRGECPMGYENIEQCRRVAFGHPEKFEEQVMSWAAEHSEPVYPTWGEWLESFGVVEVSKAKDRIITVMMKPELLNSIPADIAQKLGLQPKECI